MSYKKTNKRSCTRVYMKSRNALYTRSKAKDFAWRGRKRNPIQKVQPQGKATRTKIYIVLLFSCIVGMLGLFIYQPFFHISNVDVEGIESITQQEIEQTVYGAMDYHRWFLFPVKSFVFVNTVEIADILNERFPLNTVTVQKQFPNTLHIQLEERLSTVLYDNGDAYHFMGLTGKIVEPIRKASYAEWRSETAMVTSTNELGEEISEIKEIARYHTPDITALEHDIGVYPLIVDTGHGNTGTLEVNTEVMQESYIAQILDWYNALQNTLDMEPVYVDMSSPYRTILYIKNGPSIYITLPEGESGPQIERLRTALKEIPSLDAISYIDVRYAGKIYWQ